MRWPRTAATPAPLRTRGRSSPCATRRGRASKTARTSSRLPRIPPGSSERSVSQLDENELKGLQRRVAIAALLLLGVFLAGVVGYRIIGGPEHGWLAPRFLSAGGCH